LLCKNRHEPIRFTPEPSKSYYAYEGTRLRTSHRHCGQSIFFEFLVTVPLHSKLCFGAAPIIVPDGQRGNNPESYLNTTILHENAITFSSSRIVFQGGNHVRFQRKNSFHSFVLPHCSTDLASRGCDSGWGGDTCQNPKSALRKRGSEHFSRADS
jgi:hypothetical protein